MDITSTEILLMLKSLIAAAVAGVCSFPAAVVMADEVALP
jgi:hypothetical protein